MVQKPPSITSSSASGVSAKREADLRRLSSLKGRTSVALIYHEDLIRIDERKIEIETDRRKRPFDDSLVITFCCLFLSDCIYWK